MKNKTRTQIKRAENTDTIASLLSGARIAESANIHGVRHTIREPSYFDAPTFEPYEYRALAEVVNAINNYRGDDDFVNYAVTRLALSVRARVNGSLSNPANTARLVTDALAKAER